MYTDNIKKMNEEAIKIETYWNVNMIILFIKTRCTPLKQKHIGM